MVSCELVICLIEGLPDIVQGLHIVTGAEYANNMAANAVMFSCTPILFAAVLGFVCWFLSCFRTLSMLSRAGTVGSILAFVSLVLVPTFLAIQGKPARFRELDVGELVSEPTVAFGNPITSAWPAQAANWVTMTTSLMAITFNFVGQVMTPSFIAEMEKPE